MSALLTTVLDVVAAHTQAQSPTSLLVLRSLLKNVCHHAECYRRLATCDFAATGQPPLAGMELAWNADVARNKTTATELLELLDLSAEPAQREAMIATNSIWELTLYANDGGSWTVRGATLDHVIAKSTPE